MGWHAILRSPHNPDKYLEIWIQDCDKQEAERLCERQNLFYMDLYGRERYQLESLKELKTDG